MTDFAHDRTSGSHDVALAFLAALERWSVVDTSTTPPGLRAVLLEWLRTAQAEQPTLALVHQLAARALEIADTGVRRGDPVTALRQSIAASVAAEREDLAASHLAVTHQASALVTHRGGFIATLSNSAAVRDAILAVHAQGMSPRALIGEGRPGFEGRMMAQALAAAGVPVWLVADAALPLLLSQASHVWLGADAVTEHGVLNKVGSYGAALAAREHSIPVVAIAGRRKFIAAATRALKILEMPPGEIWDTPAPGVEPRNVYFELTPLPLLRGVVVEDGVLPPGEAAAIARERTLPSELEKD